MDSPVILYVLGAWLLLSLLVGLLLARMIRNRNRQQPGQEAAEQPEIRAGRGR